MKVKICGITRLEDAQLAVELGAFAVGFIFYEKSPRAVSATQARAIINQLPHEILKVGVFVNETVEKMLQIQNESGITTFQLHGEENSQTASRLASFIKAIRPKTGEDVATLSQFPSACYFLVDSYSAEQYGGTGKRAQESLAIAAKAFGPVILAGGLTSENVIEAIQKIEPVGVDVSSGVEKEPGIKDPIKLRNFFKAVALSREF